MSFRIQSSDFVNQETSADSLYGNPIDNGVLNIGNILQWNGKYWEYTNNTGGQTGHVSDNYIYISNALMNPESIKRGEIGTIEWENPISFTMGNIVDINDKKIQIKKKGIYEINACVTLELLTINGSLVNTYATTSKMYLKRNMETIDFSECYSFHKTTTTSRNSLNNLIVIELEIDDIIFICCENMYDGTSDNSILSMVNSGTRAFIKRL